MVAADGDAGVLTLICPNCAARFVIGQSLIGSNGRKVKCSACGERWIAYADGQAPAEIAEEAPEVSEAVDPAPEPESAGEPEDEAKPVAEAMTEAHPDIVESEPEPVVPVAPDNEDDDDEVEAEAEDASTLEDVPELVEAEDTGENTLTALRAEMVKATKVSFLGTDLFGVGVLLVLATAAAALIYFLVAAAPR